MTMESGLGTYVTYNPFAVSLATRVDDLLQMVESMATHYFPVVDDQQRLIGVVSETDLMQLSRAATQPGCETDGTIEQIVSRQLVTVDHLASPRRALQLLIDYQIQSLPVLQNGKLLGIVTTDDFLREFSYGQMICSKEPVSDILRTPAEPIDPDVTIDQAIALMDQANLNHQVVVQGGCPIGIVDRREVIKATSFGDSQVRFGGRASVVHVLRKTPAFRPGQRMNEAAALMIEHGLSALAVTNQANRFLGIITADEILKVMLGGLKP
jgi:CBS domain-containing protein